MTENHPITPPLELVQKWKDECHKAHEPFLLYIATQAAQWGADQELEACCEWLAAHSYLSASGRIRVGRRPKPPSLKEQALDVLRQLENGEIAIGERADTIRRALEHLDD